MIFEPKFLDYELSPYTGLTRESWIEAAKYILTGIFQHIPNIHAPVVMPRKETEVTYPHKDAKGLTLELEQKAEYFEGLARSFFFAAPLIHNDSNTTICRYSLQEYYKEQILRACTPGDSNFVGKYEDMIALLAKDDPFRCFQQTVETCALVVCMMECREEIWDTYTKEEQDRIADFLKGYACGNTVPQNWRLFNMLDMGFLYQMGYEIDEDIMREHACAILDYYTGDGWYRDGESFDYYSCWAFNVYAPIWNQWYGYEKEPYLAKRFEENSNALMKTFADFFDKDGFTNMWGRSNVYRNAATSPFAANLLLNDSSADPGLSRRIASGSLLQFFTREDVLFEGVPTMGFYGQFTPLVQGYSCAESPLWLGKAFLCLNLPADHPYWTEKEHNGSWDSLGEHEVKQTVLNGPALCFTNHNANGETILRTGKVMKNINDEHGMWNYGKLCYNSKYPWEAISSANMGSQQYVIRNVIRDVLHESHLDTTEKGNVMLWRGVTNDILYRRQFFNYELCKETTWMQAINLADFPVAFGIIRVDKLRLIRKPVVITLGSYGFPDNGTEIIRKEKDGAKAIILKGHDFTGKEKQMAMTIYDGWDEIDILHSEGTNPDSEKSIVIYGQALREKHNSYEQHMMISQVITKESLEDFTEEDVFPIQSVSYSDKENCGGYGPVTIELKDGSRKIIDFDGIEGHFEM